MNFHGVELCCPHCRGEFERPREAELVCRGCSRRFTVLLGIPDLRIFPDPYIGFEEERAKVMRLAERYRSLDFEGFVDFYYSITPAVTPQQARQYKRGLMAATARAAAWLEGWEATAGGGPADSLLEIGCGTAPLLAAAAKYRRRVGVDIALRWLLVGKKRLEEAGVELPLVCACAEALPLRDAEFNRVVADSAIEHVRDQSKVLTETRRVLRPGGHLFVATPNRFSLGPDPQTGVWCGSLLPRSWTDALVRRQGGVPPMRHLLSAGELQRLLGDAGFDQVRIFLPAIPAAQRAHFSGAMKALIGLYHLARRLPVSRALLRWVGPLLHGVARKRP